MTEATAPKKQLALSDEETFVDPPGADGSASVTSEPSKGEASADVDATVVDAKAEGLDVPAATPAPAAALTDAAAPEPKKAIQLRVFGRTDVGQVREHNEDNFLVADLTKGSRGLMEGDRRQDVGPRGTVLGVCDGMGGAAAGEVASQLAVDIVYQRMLAGEPPHTRDDIAARLVHSIESAGMRIFAEAKANRAQRGMGTTATVAALMDSRIFFGQVGDSRAYLLRGDRLVQVTRDQSLVNQLIEAGQLTEEEAETFEHNNIILQALGTAESVQVDLTYVDLFRGDLLLLCSDGLSGMVRNDEIREVLMAFPDPLEACRELTDRANLAGGHDNVTVVVARFEGEGLAEPTPADVEDLKYRKSEAVDSTKPTDSSGHRTSSLRPGRLSLTPNIETSEEDLEDYPELRQLRHDDPVELPHDGAPSWIVTMLIVSAVTCIVVLGYYFLRP
jgi:PPM family protein phosphatase